MEIKPYTGVVYTATNKLNGTMYVGKSIHGLAVRRKDHQNNARRGKEGRFNAALRKHGENSFDWSEYYLSDDNEQLLSVEVTLIAQLKALGTELYNLTRGGEGVIGYAFTEQARRKMSLAAMGRKPTPEAIEKTAAALRGRKKSKEHVEAVRQANLGRKCSPETIERMTAANRDRAQREKEAGITRSISKENKAKLRQVNLGKKHSEEARANMSAAQKARGPRAPHSQQTRDRIAAAHKGMKASLETRKKISEIQKGKKRGPCSEQKRQNIIKAWARRLEKLAQKPLKPPYTVIPGKYRKSK